MLVLKKCLGERSLSASYTGGLSSYALFLMVTRFVEEASDSSGKIVPWIGIMRGRYHGFAPLCVTHTHIERNREILAHEATLSEKQVTK